MTPEGAPRYHGGYPDYIVNHERRPGVGPLAGWRGAEGENAGRGAPNPHQLERYIANGCFWKHELPEDQLYFKHANNAYLKAAVADGVDRQARDRSCCSSMSSRCSVSASLRKGMEACCRRKRTASASRLISIRCRSGTCRSRRPGSIATTFPLHALTQRPMQMYHSWHSQNAWLRQILGNNRLFVNRTAGRALGLEEEDWVWLSSHHGRIRVPTKLMDGVNPDTVWTWNAIGKRRGAWNLEPDSPEFRKGFLLNHLISELLPPDSGYSYSNADPITGQAAWYDLRVRIERVAQGEAEITAPSFGIARTPCFARPSARDSALFRGKRTRGARAMTSLPERAPGQKKLGLVIDLDICVGCHACATACKEWNASGHMGPLPDFNAYGEGAWGVWFNRIHSFEEGEGEGARTIHFPKSCLHCEEPACVTVCPTGASYKRAEDGIVLVNKSICIGCKLCSWACPYGAREFDADEGVMKKCTLCIDRIYNENWRPRTAAGLCHGVSGQRPAFRRSGRSRLGGVGNGRAPARRRSDAGTRLQAGQQISAAEGGAHGADPASRRRRLAAEG